MNNRKESPNIGMLKMEKSVEKNLGVKSERKSRSRSGSRSRRGSSAGRSKSRSVSKATSKAASRASRRSVARGSASRSIGRTPFVKGASSNSYMFVIASLFILIDVAIVIMYMYGSFAHATSGERVSWMKKHKWWFVGLMSVSLVMKGVYFWLTSSSKWSASVYATSDLRVQGVEIPILPLSFITFAGLTASLFHSDDKLGDSLASSAVVIHSVILAATVIKSTSLAYSNK